MKNFWNLTSSGVTNELEVVNEFEQHLQFDGERYVVKLLIEPHHEFLPDNHENSVNHYYCITSFNKACTQVLRGFKSCSRRVGDSRW